MTKTLLLTILILGAIAATCWAVFITYYFVAILVVFGGEALIKHERGYESSIKVWQTIALTPLVPGLAVVTAVTFIVRWALCGLFILIMLPVWLFKSVPKLPMVIRKAPAAVKSWLTSDIY